MSLWLDGTSKSHGAIRTSIDGCSHEGSDLKQDSQLYEVSKDAGSKSRAFQSVSAQSLTMG
jgi:hypothetical protein